jgi:hypothetical protein
MFLALLHFRFSVAALVHMVPTSTVCTVIETENWKHENSCPIYNTICMLKTHSFGLQAIDSLLRPLVLPFRAAAHCQHAVLVQSHPFCTMFDLQLIFYRPLVMRVELTGPYAVSMCLKLAGPHSYFVVTSINEMRDKI